MPVYTITEEDKERLREPRGDVFQDDALIKELQERDYHRLICVGDRVAMDVATAGIDADIVIVDGRIERAPVEDEELDRIDTDLRLDTTNPAGQITETAWNTVREAFAHTCTTTVMVDGEEDLLALPAILFASPNSLIVYGDRWNGAVILEPDDALKAFARDLVGFKPFPHVIVGGSWDRFHAGHRYILLAAFEHGEQVDLGITSNEMLEEKTGNQTESFTARKEHVETFLDTFHLQDRTELMELEDYRGNAVDADDAVLLVTEDTLPNAKRINEERLENGKTPLKLAVLERITANGGVISSTRIRAGEIDRDGFILQ